MRTATKPPVQALIVLCFSTACWAFSFGLSAPLASLWLERAGCNDTLIGLNWAAYYAGLALAAAAAPAAMRRWGLGSSVAGMALAGVTVAAFPCFHSLTWWFGLRFVCGAAGALSLIPLETFVNRDLGPENRGRNFGLYAVALALGCALGNWLGLQMVATMPRSAFLLGGLVAVLGAVGAHLGLPAIGILREASPLQAALAWRDNLLSYGSAWCVGFLEGGMIAFMSLYLIGLGLTEHDTGWLISFTMVGVIAVQMPVAWVADRLGRQSVLLVCFALTAVGLAALPFAGATWLLPVSLVVVGACSSAFYPLGLALLGEKLPASQLDRANALYLSVECVGCLMGPAVMGMARDWGGERAMFVAGEAAVLLVLGCWLALRPRHLHAGLASHQGPERRAA